VGSDSVAQHREGAAAPNGADAEIITRADAEAAETTEVVVEVPSNEAVRGVSSEGAKRATELDSEYPESLDVEEVVTSARVLEPNILICQRVLLNPSSCSVVTSPDSAYGTESTLRTSRPFELDETLVKPTELSFETYIDITPTQCRSAPSQPNKARMDDGTIPRHVSHECRNPRSHSTEGSSVNSESASAIWHANTDRKSHNDGSSQNQRIQRERSFEAKSVVRQKTELVQLCLQMMMSTFKLPNQGTF